MSAIKTCTICEGILVMKETEDSLYFLCSKCLHEYKSTDEDTELFHKSLDEKKQSRINGNLIKYISKDNTNMRVRRACPECKSDDEKILSCMVFGESMEYIYMCADGHVSY